MDDDDGFTMVDETFGVREPSDCSDQEEEEENPPRFQKVTLVPGGPVQLGEESSSTAPVASSPHVPLATSSDDDSHVLLTALSGMESADTQGGASKTASRGVLAMLRRGINPESADAGQVIITSDKPSMLRETASSASTPGLKIPAAAAPTTAAVVVQDTPSEIGPGGPPGPSASTKKDSKEMNAIVIPASLVPAAKPNKASSINCVATTTPSGAAAAVTSPSRRSEPTASAATPSSGAAAPNAQALIRKAVFVALAADPAAAAEEEEKPATAKTLTVRLVPGDCAFRAAVPRTGPGSLNTVAHVKREIERKLGLRQLVHLSFVVARNPEGDLIDSLEDAPDGSTIEAFSEESVLVRARVCRRATMATFFSTQSSAVASTFPSSESQYVQLPRRGFWMSAAKSQLGLHADSRVMARCLTPPSCLKGEEPPRIPEDLRHGDTLFMFVLEEDLGVGVDAAGDGDGDGAAGVGALSPCFRSTRLRKPPKKGAVGSLPRASALAVTVPPPPEVAAVARPAALGDTGGEKEVAKGVINSTAAVVVAGPGLVTATVHNQPTLGCGRGASSGAARASAAAATASAAHPPGGQLQHCRQIDDARRKGAGGRRPVAVGSPPTPTPAPAAPATAFQGPYGTTYRGRPAMTAPIALLPPAATPSKVKMGADLAPRAEPLPSPRAQNWQPEVTATPGQCSVSQQSEPWASACAFGGKKAVAASGKSPPCAASTVSDEDDAAVAELVGMGFDRDHVVRALRKCRRGDSWKESAISLLLEPQLAHSEGPETDLEAGLNRLDGPATCPRSCPICLSDILPEEVFTVDCANQHAFCVDCLYQHCSVQLLESGLIPACPLSNMTCGHELSQEEVERVFLLRAYSSTRVGTGGALSECGGHQSDQDKRALEACRTMLTRRGLKSTGAIPCVSAACGNWMVPEGNGQRVRCSSCLTEFCARCKRSPYHYAAECDDVVRLTREWALWLTEGKATFLRAVAEQDKEHMALLLEHEGKRKKHDLAVEEAERLRLEYDKMETWKESRCRRCPMCGRTIEKLSGCDLMLCGLDAHGGNYQNGCGARFDWKQAAPYVGDRGVRKKIPFTEKEPAVAARSRHFIADGIPLRCDRCHQDVVGPLFRCIHCPSFVCCLECQDMACRDARHVFHTFQVVAEGTNVSTSTPLAASAENRSRGGGGGGGADGGGGAGVGGVGVAGVGGGDSAGGACAMDVDDLV